METGSLDALDMDRLVAEQIEMVARETEMGSRRILEKVWPFLVQHLDAEEMRTLTENIRSGRIFDKRFDRVYNAGNKQSKMRGGKRNFEPSQWRKCGLHCPQYDREYSDWAVAYHGTDRRSILRILVHGLRKPGPGVPVRHGQVNSATGKSIYVSPSIEYAAFPVYSVFIAVSESHWVQIVLECRVRPGSFAENQATLKPTHWPTDVSIDPNFPKRAALEWLIERPDDVVVCGLLVREFGKGADAEVYGRLAQSVSSMEEPEFAWTNMRKRQARLTFHNCVMDDVTAMSSEASNSSQPMLREKEKCGNKAQVLRKLTAHEKDKLEDNRDFIERWALRETDWATTEGGAHALPETAYAHALQTIRYLAKDLADIPEHLCANCVDVFKRYCARGAAIGAFARGYLRTDAVEQQNVREALTRSQDRYDLVRPDPTLLPQLPPTTPAPADDADTPQTASVGTSGLTKGVDILATLPITCVAVVNTMVKYHGAHNEPAWYDAWGTRNPHADKIVKVGHVLAKLLREEGYQRVRDFSEEEIACCELLVMRTLGEDINAPSFPDWIGKFCENLNILTRKSYEDLLKKVSEACIERGGKLVLYPDAAAFIPPRQMAIGLFSIGLVSARLLNGKDLHPDQGNELETTAWLHLLVDIMPGGNAPVCDLDDEQSAGLLSMLCEAASVNLDEVRKASSVVAHRIQDLLLADAAPP